MELIRIHECLCDRTRLRIAHLLLRGPLCVCHIQAVLREPQVKVSRHLAYMRRRGLIECQRQAQWMLYSLPKKQSPLVQKNLACLQDCCGEDRIFQKDAARLLRLASSSDCLPGESTKRKPSHCNS